MLGHTKSYVGTHADHHKSPRILKYYHALGPAPLAAGFAALSLVWGWNSWARGSRDVSLPSHPQPPVSQFLRNVPEIHASRRRGRVAPYVHCVPSLRITFAFMVCNATCSSPPLFRIRIIFVTLMARFHSLRSRGLQNCVLKTLTYLGRL